MKLKTVLFILGEIRYLRSIVKKYAELLSPGKYRLFPGFKSMALDAPETLECAQAYFNKPGVNTKMASLADKLNKIGYFKNRSKRSSAKYEAFYTANNHDKVREVKLFSFTRGKILTICTSKAEAERQIEQYKLLCGSYNMPMVEADDSISNAIEVSMVRLCSCSDDVLFAKSICDSVISFNPHPEDLCRSRVSDLISFSYDNEEMNTILRALSDEIDPSLLNILISLCLQHGDLSKDNLIYGESDGKLGFWWID